MGKKKLKKIISWKLIKIIVSINQQMLVIGHNKFYYLNKT